VDLTVKKKLGRKPHKYFLGLSHVCLFDIAWVISSACFDMPTWKSSIHRAPEKAQYIVHRKCPGKVQHIVHHAALKNKANLHFYEGFF
jgi:hypothetical protein